MNAMTQCTPGERRQARQPSTATRFPATAGRFDTPAARTTIDTLADWVGETYREALRRRPSMHVYIRTLPKEIVARIDELRACAAIREAILAHFGPGVEIVPMTDTDELYISHYNKDLGGDQGLFSPHYDGNLRFLPSCAVVRSLIYLRSDGSYRVAFRDSGVTHAFATYDFGLLDFHRELHWVEGAFDPAAPQRILLKCNYLVVARGHRTLARIALAANRGVFFVVKAAMEYSKSPRTPAQRAVGLLCNLFRRMNIVHPFVPFAFLAGTGAAAGWLALRLAT